MGLPKLRCHCSTLYLVLLLYLTTLAFASPANRRQPESSGPVISTDFPDPSIIYVDGVWYAFGTQSIFDYPDIRVQVATSLDFENWILTDKDALEILAPWVNASDPQVWAPDVYRRADGSFILFYSALSADPAAENRMHCIGTATSSQVTGPYESNSDTPFACPLHLGGAIDASAFHDPDDGSNYVVYKIDGNTMGHGGICGNTIEPMMSTPIMIQRVEEDWTTPIGEAQQILDRGEYDGPLVEGPAMIKRDGVYYLFFSSQCYMTAMYDTSYATAASPMGPFVKTQFPLLVSGSVAGTFGPGHADVEVDASGDAVHIAFHAYAADEDVGGRRAMYVRRVDVGGDLVALH